MWKGGPKIRKASSVTLYTEAQTYLNLYSCSVNINFDDVDINTVICVHYFVIEYGYAEIQEMSV